MNRVLRAAGARALPLALVVSAITQGACSCGEAPGPFDAGIPPPPACQIDSPADGATLVTDATTLPGFQIVVDVSCVNVPPQTALAIAANGRNVSGATVAAVLQADHTATATVTAPGDGPVEIVLQALGGDLGVIEDRVDVSVEPPQPEGCAAEFVSPEPDAELTLDVNPGLIGFQTIVEVAAIGRDPACTGGTITVTGGEADVSAGLPGTLDASGVAQLIVTVPVGDVTLTAQILSDGVAGASASVAARVVPPPINLVLDSGNTCALADRCFRFGDASNSAGSYVRDLEVVAQVSDGGCPYTAPTITLDGGTPIAADETGGDAWSVDGTVCRARFSDVDLAADELPNGVVVAVDVQAATLVGDEEETQSFTLGIDLVPPTLDWGFDDGTSFGLDDDQMPGGDLDLSLPVVVTDLAGRTLSLVTQDGVERDAKPVGTPVFNTTFDVSLPDGDWTLTLQGTDAAGNTVVASARTIRVDSAAPCVATLTVAADADGDGRLGIAEAGQPASSSVTAAFAADDCAVENGRTATLLDGTTSLATAVTSANAVTFPDVALVERAYTLSISVSDAAGNEVATGAPNELALLVDLTGPSCAILLPSADPLLAGDDEDAAPGLQIGFTVQSDAADGQPVSLADDGSEIATGTLSGGSATLTATGGGAITLADGAHDLVATCTDAAGNSTASAPYAPLVDATPPALAWVSPPASLNPGDDEDAALGLQYTFTVSHASLEEGQVISLFEADGQGAPVGLAYGSVTVPTGQGSDDGTPVQLGLPVTLFDCVACSFVVTAEDVNGNPGVSAPTVIDVDAGAYAVQLMNPDGVSDPLQIGEQVDEDAAAGAQVTVVAATSAPAGSVAELYVDGALTETLSTTGTTITFAQVTLAEGGPVGRTLEVQVSNSGAGKQGTSQVREYVVDLSPPTIAWTIPDPQALAGEDAQLTLNAAAPLGGAPTDAAGTAGYQGALAANVVDCDGGQVLVTVAGESANNGTPPAVAGADVTQTVNVTVTDGDDQVLTVTCTDLAGNEASAQVTADVDTVAPAAPQAFAVDSDNVLVREGVVPLTFTAAGDDGTVGAAAAVDLVAALQAIDAGTFDAPPAAARPQTLSLDGAATGGTFSGLAFHNTWHFAARAADDVGNTSPLSQAQVDLDLLTRQEQHVEDDVADGAAVNDQFGSIMTLRPGDLNDDGADDFVIVAKNEGDDCAFGFCNGALYVLYGPGTGGDVSAPALQQILGPSDGAVTIGFFDVDIVPSINGEDDIPDLIVSAFDGGLTPAVYVWYGVTGGGQLSVMPDYAITDPASVTFDAPFSRRISGVGDVTGDDIGDFLVADHEATPPRLYLFAGTATKQSADVLRADAMLAQLNGPPRSAGNLVGMHAVGLGNVDPGTTGDDPIGDFAVGYSAPDGVNAGVVYVLKGRSTWAADSPVDLASVTTPDQRLTPQGSRNGLDVAAGDVDGDGFVDVVSSHNSGASVLRGSANGTFAFAYRVTNDSGLSSTRGIVLADADADGLMDLWVPGDRGAHLYFGDDRTTGTRSVPDATWDFGVDNVFLVGGPGDLDGDGYADLAVGSSGLQQVRIFYGP